PTEARVRVGDEKLIEITGARQPSGVPVVHEPEPRRERSDRPRRFGDRPQRGGYRGDRSERNFGDRPSRNGERSGHFRRDVQRNDRREGGNGDRRFSAPRPARAY
ncbi:MAG TPA: RNA helicase, partial [Actinoplanes sp.]|nr:RNA helicase [Actinoplanes sp.]